jgi:hypothetical protein
MNKPLPRVGVVIVNWKSPADTLRCLASLETATYPNLLITVVENGSGDNSADLLRQAYPELNLLISQQNLGYTGGNNLGIRSSLASECEFVFLLNDDAIVEAQTLAELVAAASQHPQAGFLGPKILAIEEPELLLSAGGTWDSRYLPANRGMGETDAGQYNQPKTVDFLSGCALLVRREVIEQVGLLDEDYFAYNEEVDWCYRGLLAGFQAVYVPTSRVWHPDTRRRDQDSPNVTYYTTRNSLLFARKRRAGAGMLLFHHATYLRRLLSWSLRPKWRKAYNPAHRAALRQALLDDLRGQYGIRPAG